LTFDFCFNPFLDDVGLKIGDCRGQSYDNAANMAGMYMGLQARIKAMNLLAHFVQCAAHLLNLVGACAAECCVNAVFFRICAHVI